MKIFILAEGLKDEFFLILSGRESSLLEIFWQSCVDFDLAHLAVHIIWRFVIQAFPTLSKEFYGGS